jgi:hypothetical protein
VGVLCLFFNYFDPFLIVFQGFSPQNTGKKAGKFARLVKFSLFFACF